MVVLSKLKLDLWLLHSIVYLDGLLSDKAKISQFWPTRNPEYKKTDQTNSVQLSLKSHPLWATLYLNQYTEEDIQIFYQLWDTLYLVFKNL